MEFCKAAASDAQEKLVVTREDLAAKFDPWSAVYSEEWIEATKRLTESKAEVASLLTKGSIRS